MLVSIRLGLIIVSVVISYGRMGSHSDRHGGFVKEEVDLCAPG